MKTSIMGYMGYILGFYLGMTLRFGVSGYNPDHGESNRKRNGYWDFAGIYQEVGCRQNLAHVFFACLGFRV